MARACLALRRASKSCYLGEPRPRCEPATPSLFRASLWSRSRARIPRRTRPRGRPMSARPHPPRRAHLLRRPPARTATTSRASSRSTRRPAAAAPPTAATASASRTRTGSSSRRTSRRQRPSSRSRAGWLGSAGGCGNLGHMLEVGDEIPKDVARAVSLYNKACDAKWFPACRYLGDLYWLGKNAKEDRARAASFFQVACGKRRRDVVHRSWQRVSNRRAARGKTRPRPPRSTRRPATRTRASAAPASRTS